MVKNQEQTALTWGRFFVVLGGLSVASSCNGKIRQRDEARMLAEALLDAEVRIGELFKKMPKAPGTRTDLQLPQTTSGKSSEMEPRFTDEPRLTPKQEAAKKFGFDSNQVKRFETLASNPDLVEQVKAEAYVLWEFFEKVGQYGTTLERPCVAV